MSTTARPLLNKLFEYIGEQLKQINPAGFNLSNHTGFYKKPSDIAGLPGVDLDICLEGDHIWLKVARLDASDPPKIAKEFSQIISISTDPFGPPPSLIESGILYQLSDITNEIAAKYHLEIETKLRNSANQALEEYCKIWNTWSEGEKPRRKTINLYSDLFTLKHQIDTEETAKPIELIWGIGYTVWNLDKVFSFEYPLITQTVEITFDEKSLGIEVRPRNIGPSIELEAFIKSSIPGAAEAEKFVREDWASNAENFVTPFSSSSYEKILKLVATNLDSRGLYKSNEPLNLPLLPEKNQLIVTDQWVVFSRPKTNNYLIDDLKRLQEKLNQGCDIPEGPLALVTPPSDTPIKFEPISFRGLSSRSISNGGKNHEELYFPLPYNEEQVTIIKRLKQAAGVTVQGPPGTGKTHTIANIICHYLAMGKRILVTSRGEAALKVLQSKLPEEIQPLTVALLTNDQEGIRQFQGSINAIQHRVSQLNVETLLTEIKLHQEAINKAHNDLEKIDSHIDKIALAQLSEIEVDGILMRAQDMAELVLSGHEQFHWFNDNLSLDHKHSPPLSEQEIGELREARRKIGADIVYVNTRIPSPAAMLPVNEVAELHEILCQIKQLDNEEKSGKLPSLRAMTEEVITTATELLILVDDVKNLTAHLESLNVAWPMQLREKCAHRVYDSERLALEALFEEIELLVKARVDFMINPVELDQEIFNLPKARESIMRAAKTGKPFNLFSLGISEEKRHISAVKISGLSPNKIEDWIHIHNYIVLNEKIISFITRWNQFANTLYVPTLQGNILSLQAIEPIILAARDAYKLGTQLDPKLLKLAEQVFTTALTYNNFKTTSEITILRQNILKHLSKATFAKAAIKINILQEKLIGCAGPISQAVLQFINEELGNSNISIITISTKYTTLLSELKRISNLAMELAIIHDFSKRIEESGAPLFANRIRTLPVDSVGEDKTLPSAWKKAWTWARVKTYLSSIESRKELPRLSRERAQLEVALSRLYQDMVARAAWCATKQNCTPKILQALAGYATAIRRIGQGTGPNAARYRRDARGHMHDASGAVPCWIMNHSKISESIPADIGIFDLVIVDEASQSDLWALPAIVRGKKILVVGDDKQVSPDGSFNSSEAIQDLKNRFLSDQPYGTEMTPEKSLYDLAARVFASGQVMLREHFRCVPAIINYSNQMFYKGNIQPLRIPKPSERIEPPLVDVYIENGYRDKKIINFAEAEFIAEEIASILNNPQFISKTIGVISLLDVKQAKYIDTLVRKRCSAVELHSRKFACGNASMFQGSERDIIFLTLVADRSSCKALSGNVHEQRFNVAASRARDRMYLVRSVNYIDLSDKDLRRSLLDHFHAPLVRTEAESNALIELCESQFERDVFSKLTACGYRVIPQVQSGAYRIDMVVEGAGSTRLAIECDGDQFHGPERWAQDTLRQRVLERAGWTFWRCFASTWTLHNEEIFNELLQKLASMGIEPLGALERIPSLVETRKWVFSSKEVTAVDNILNSAISEVENTGPSQLN